MPTECVLGTLTTRSSLRFSLVLVALSPLAATTKSSEEPLSNKIGHQ